MAQRICPVLIAIFLVIGCEAPPVPPPAPRPVSVLTVTETDPGRFERVTGTVASWKTDQLGFEVDGRVQFVIEPETDIAGQVYDKDGNVLTEGNLLARLDPTRYELAVESAKAQVAVAEKQRESTQIEYERVIPAETEAATARRDLAQIEVERNTKLFAEKAAPGRAVDLSKSTLRQREAELDQLAASKEAKASEVASIEAEIRELNESQKKSERDEEVFLYPIKSSPEAARRLFLVYLERINDLADDPEWYHLLKNSCTINIVRYKNASGREGGFDYRHLLNGWIDRYFYDTSMVDTSLPFEELRRRSHINKVTQATDGTLDALQFSRRIRESLPGERRKSSPAMADPNSE